MLLEEIAEGADHEKRTSPKSTMTLSHLRRQRAGICSDEGASRVKGRPFRLNFEEGEDGGEDSAE
jgi:hypothetical protein